MAMPEPAPLPSPQTFVDDGSSKCTPSQFKAYWDNTLNPCITSAQRSRIGDPQTYGEFWNLVCNSINSMVRLRIAAKKEK